MSAIETSDVGAKTSSRWAADPYPDYVAEVNQSIAFSGVEQDFFTRGKGQRMLDALRRRGCEPRRQRLLDIGCGVGLIHKHVSTEFREVVGVDLAAEALAAARQSNPSVTYREQIGPALPVEPESFDVATTICVMHHVPLAQRPDFVARAVATLKPGGWFLVFEHNPWNPLTRLAVARCPFDFDAILISAPQLARMLRDAGLVEVQSEFMFFTPFSNRFCAASESGLRFLPLGAQHLAIGRRPL